MLVLLFFLTILPFILTSNCPNGTVEYGGNCYIFQLNSTEFATAEISCNGLGGHLVSIHNAFTNALLTGEAPNFFQDSTEVDFWIGATTMMIQKNWTWMDNSPFDFTDWLKGEPQNISSANCAAISISNGAWSSQDCIKKKPYVCDVTPHPTFPPYVSCPFGWSYFQPTGCCYGCNGTADQHLGKINWTLAEEHCETFGAHLVSIHSYEEFKFVESYDTYAWDGPIWTGLFSNDGGKTWRYTDDSPFDYPFWMNGTNTSTSGCVVSSIYNLQVLHCSDPFLYLCKKKA